MKEITTEKLFDGKKVRQPLLCVDRRTGYFWQVILFAVPGAFTPTCSLKHLPGFIEKADELKAAGVDSIACISVNDAFVMDAWGKSVGAEGKVMMLADGSALFTKVTLWTSLFLFPSPREYAVEHRRGSGSDGSGTGHPIETLRDVGGGSRSQGPSIGGRRRLYTEQCRRYHGRTLGTRPVSSVSIF